MERLLMFLVICVFAKAMENRDHTKLVRASEEEESWQDVVPRVVKKVPCSSSLDNERNTLTEEAECGTPKKILYYLGHLTRKADEEIYPEAVWIKQCVGVCSEADVCPNMPYSRCSKCTPGKTVKREIPLRIVNNQTSQEACATHTLEEHESCQCTGIDGHKYVKP